MMPVAAKSGQSAPVLLANYRRLACRQLAMWSTHNIPLHGVVRTEHVTTTVSVAAQTDAELDPQEDASDNKEVEDSTDDEPLS